MKTGDMNHQPGVHRHREAVLGYALILGAMSIPIVLAVFTSRQWGFVGYVLLIEVVTLRYLVPVSATVLPDGRVRYVWPLRRVTVGPENLVKAKVTRNAISQEPMLALRVHRSVGFTNAFSSKWTDGPRLAAALASLVADASRVPTLDRQACAALLDAATRRDD